MNIREKYRKFRVDFEEVCRKSKRNSSDINVLYAVKYLDKDGLREFLKILAEEKQRGIIYLGENRVQEGEKKIGVIEEYRNSGDCRHVKRGFALPRNDIELQEIKNCYKDVLDIRYAMIGPLQKNKINKALEIFDEIHSIDSIDIAEGISKRLKKGITMPVMLEVNISKEEQKHGFRTEKIGDVISQIRLLDGLKLIGLMTMAPFTNDENIIRSLFRKHRDLADKYGLKTSMGMSNDWKIAVEEGSDMIRVGGAIFIE
ncbi:Predicted pyridoxal phosphate-dependent enzyme, YBL036C type [sediment metagenome]|uniref:Predicted pyridoxal phosphate-dependent enzyme, YBL036C type n=1 Tax=sediment metagenome TaxID=749907 RepID=D9PES5_9ZZZZ